MERTVEYYAGIYDGRVDHHEVAKYNLIQQESGWIGCGIFQPTEEMPSNCISLAVLVNDLQAYLDRILGLTGTYPIPLRRLPPNSARIPFSKTSLAVDNHTSSSLSRSRAAAWTSPQRGASEPLCDGLLDLMRPLLTG